MEFTSVVGKTGKSSFCIHSLHQTGKSPKCKTSMDTLKLIYLQL